MQSSSITATWRAPLQVLQRKYGLLDLAPDRSLVAAKSLEDSIVEVGQTKKGARKLAFARVPPGLEDIDNLADFPR